MDRFHVFGSLARIQLVSAHIDRRKRIHTILLTQQYPLVLHFNKILEAALAFGRCPRATVVYPPHRRAFVSPSSTIELSNT